MLITRLDSLPTAEMTYKKVAFTWAIIVCEETREVLLLNRQKAPWMGRWNGIGGKLDEGETPLQCIIREAEEETGLHIQDFRSKGIMRWIRDGNDLGGMYLFVAFVDRKTVEEYGAPKKFCNEGILDWKQLDWILHEENTGVVDNVKLMLNSFFPATDKALYVSTYVKTTLDSVAYYEDGELMDIYT